MPVENNGKETGVVDPFSGPQYTKINPSILQGVGYDSRGKSIYHAMTVSLNKRYNSGLQFGVNYTFSKTLDDVIDFSSSQTWFTPSRLNKFRAVSVFDFPHIFSMNAIYNTPLKSGPDHNIVARVFADMVFAPVLTLRSGIPFSIRMPSLANGLPSLDANFATPWNASRDSSRGYPYYTLDLHIHKSLNVMRERGVRVDLIADGTNILNRVNFNKVWDQFPAVQSLKIADTGATLNLLNGPFNLNGFKPVSSDQLQGHPLAFISADNPRRVQFGLRVIF
jgi:hypothetical protein